MVKLFSKKIVSIFIVTEDIWLYYKDGGAKLKHFKME